VAIVFADWMNGNEVRNYPLHDQATKRSADGSVLADGIIADLNIMLPQSAGRFAYVSSVAVTPGLASLTILATDVDPLLAEPESSSSSSSDEVTFVPVAAITVAKPITLYKHYPLDALYPGVAGWIAFGSDVDEVTATYRFLSPIDGILCAKAVRAYRDYPVTSIGREGRLSQLTGLVQLYASGDAVIGKSVRTINGRRTDVLTIGLNLETEPVDMLHKYAGECGARPEDRTCAQGRPLLTINGVEPDCNGNIDIIFENLDVQQTGLEDGMIVDLPLGLEDVCTEFDPARYDPVDECAPSSSSPVPSSSSTPPEPSSSSSSSSSPEPPSTEYYDDFSDPDRTFRELQIIDGTWYIKEVAASEAIVGRLRLHCESAALTNAIIHPQIRRTAAAGYWIFSVVRPYSTDANGYVIFGYKGIDDFWYAGFSIKTTDAPYGYLYVGHRTGDLGSVLDNWPRGLEYGHQFDAAGDPNIGVSPSILPGTLLGIDVRTEVKVSPIAGSNLNLVQVRWFWNRSGQGFPNPTEPFNTCEFVTGFDLDGYCGMGAAACETHYDNFGILNLP
jgi:hypothetical protein